MYKSYFDIDGINYIFEGYTDGTLWNGWATPWFTKEVAEELIKTMQWYDGQWATYTEGNDSFCICDEHCEIIEEYKGKDFIIDGEELHLYPIGAWNWVWDNIATYQSKESKFVWDCLLEDYHWLKGKALHKCYYGIIQEINGYMSIEELKAFTDGFMAAYMKLGGN